jgi:hypothetical protein
MMQVTSLYETSVSFQWTTRHYIPETKTLHNQPCEYLDKFHISKFQYVTLPITFKLEARPKQFRRLSSLNGKMFLQYLNKQEVQKLRIVREA